MKKHINKCLVITKKDEGDFQNSTTSWIFDHALVNNDIEVRDHITGKYGGIALRGYNIKVKLNLVSQSKK